MTEMTRRSWLPSVPGFLLCGKSQSVLWHTTVVVAATVLVTLAMRPLLLHAADHVPNKALGDQLWQAASMEAQLLALPGNIEQFWSINFYYGAGPVAFANDLRLGLLAIFAPLRLVTGNTMLAYNLTWHLALVLDAVLMCAAISSLTRNRWAGIAAGAIYGFAPIQMNYALAGFNYSGSWWIPLTLLFCVRFQRAYRWQEFALAVLCVWLQFVTVVLLSYIAAAVLFTFGAIPGLWHTCKNREWRLPVAMGISTIVISAVFVPVILSYLQYAARWDAQRDLSEVQTWSVKLRDYLSPSARLTWYEPLRDRFPTPTSDRRTFPGFIPVLAAMGSFGLVAVTARRQPQRIWIAVGALALGATAVLFTLGTHWKWQDQITDIELPYLFLFEHFTAFRAIRVVSRFAVMLNVAIAILAGIGVAAAALTAANRRWIGPVAGTMIAVGVLVEGWTVPMNVSPVVEDPDLQAVLQQIPDGPVIYLPVSQGDEIRRLWLSTKANVGPLVNGYAGSIWPSYWYFLERTSSFGPSQAASLAEGLRAYGVRSIIIERTKLPDPEGPSWRALRGASYVEAIYANSRWEALVLLAEKPSVADGWPDLNVSLLLTHAQPGSGVTTMLTIANPTGRTWMHHDGPAFRRARVVWSKPGSYLEHETVVRTPPFMAADQTYAAPLHLFVPATSGRYRLRLIVDEVTIVDQKVVVGPIFELPFNGTGAGLDATLHVRSATKVVGAPGEAVPLHVDAINIGPVTWSGDANIRVGWHWVQQTMGGVDRILPGDNLRIPLLAHETGPIRPGHGYAFRGHLVLPKEPGDYIARPQMLSELVAWFGTQLPEIQVRVTPPTQ